LEKAMKTYYEEIQAKYILRLRGLLKGLPPLVYEFMNSLSDNTSARTRVGYAYDIGVFLNFLCNEAKGFDKEAAELTVDDLKAVTQANIEEFKMYLEYYIKDGCEKSKVVVNHALGKARKLSAVRSLYRYLQKKGKLVTNPTDLVDFPKITEKGIIRLEYNEVAQLLDVVESGEGLTPKQKEYHGHTKVRDLAIFTLMLGTGIRVSECVGIDIQHLDFENGGIYITRKGGGQALIYFGDEVEQALDKYMELREELHAKAGHENALFLSMHRTRLDVRTIQMIVKKYTRIVTGFKNITPHKLRSTYGTNLYRETGDIYLVADVLGHKSVETTRKHYADMADENRRKAARVVKLRE
jgi:site-specific recombinase XerD